MRSVFESATALPLVGLIQPRCPSPETPASEALSVIIICLRLRAFAAALKLLSYVFLVGYLRDRHLKSSAFSNLELMSESSPHVLCRARCVN